MHTHQPVPRRASLWFLALLGSLAISLAFVTAAHAEAGVEGNPNNYECHGHIAAGKPEIGSSEPQVQYVFYCDGPITGYQLESQIPLAGFGASPLVTNAKAEPLSDTFSCGGEVPGFADNCVGATKLAFETITGQFAVSTPLCAEPRVDPLLTVTYAYLEKGVVTQAISGPFDLGRPHGCPASSYKGGTRLDPTPTKVKVHKHKKSTGKTKGKSKQSKTKNK